MLRERFLGFGRFLRQCSGILRLEERCAEILGIRRLRRVVAASACAYRPRHERPPTLQATAGGFGHLLDWRPLDFADTVPNVFCCTLCGVMPAFPKRLTPCCHVFCQPCFDTLVQREHRCPLDQMQFTDDAVETLDSVRGGIYQLRALCPNASSGCTVVTVLPELKDHVAGPCDFNQVQCPRCGAAVLQKAALSHYLEDCAGAHRRVTSPVSSDTASVGSASDEDASHRSDHRTSRSVKGLDKAKSQGGSSIGVHRSSSAETAGTAESNPDLVAAIRSLLHETHGGSIRSASRKTIRVPSVETSLIKTGRKSASSSKSDLPKWVTAKAPKSAEGVPEDDKALSKKRLLGRVDSLLAKVTETVAQAGVAAAAPAVEVAQASKSSSSSSGSSGKKSASSSASPHRRSRKHDSKRAKGVVRAGAASPAGFACCYITGVLGAEARIACGEELVLRSDSSQLADCTFRVHARLRRDADGSVLLCFTLCLCGGTWHQVAEWALANKESVPHPARWDFWSPTSELKLKELAAGGFVSSGAICIALEIE
ncbi:hypothetical protein HPB52_019111 [Rhipicephalus sanguineus]|uniref:RING-type domain-containing protein n=1 Tax=Rhipicephalus sanguineus TaxID=34632 RepID=A0A9D4T5X8_RHISA|nr:hypothetical protein HPB52_019111 [Rhipicephalus sanguineus]